MIHLKSALLGAGLLLAPQASAGLTSGVRGLLQNGGGRPAKDKNGAVIPETTATTTTTPEAATCGACNGACEPCVALDITAGVTIDNCGDSTGTYKCDVIVSRDLLPWKGEADSISWVKVAPGSCDQLNACTEDGQPNGKATVKREDVTTGVKVFSVAFPDGDCVSNEICLYVHDGSQDPCKPNETSGEPQACDAPDAGDKCINSENQKCQLCKRTLTVAKPAEATCDDGYGCTLVDKCYGAGCGKAGAEPCQCNVLNGDYQNVTPASDAYCQKTPADGGTFGDAFSCTTETCDPKAAGTEKSGCVESTTVDADNKSCSEKIDCTLDLCAPAEKLPGDEQDPVTGCVNRKRDAFCLENHPDALGCTSEVCTATAEGTGCESQADTDEATAFCDDYLGCTTNTCAKSKPTRAGDYDTTSGCFTEYNDAFCKNQDNYADAYSCTVESCSPKAPGADADASCNAGTGCTGCATAVQENACSDNFACTADKCYAEVDGKTPACSSGSAYNCIEATTGCVYTTQDNVCTPLKDEVGCGTFNCGDDSAAGSVDFGAFGNGGTYTGCFGVPEVGSCGDAPQCGSNVCDLTLPNPSGCGIEVEPEDDAQCKETPDDFCTDNSCIASGDMKGTCTSVEVDNGERVCQSCTADGDCTPAACETATCYPAGSDYANTCNFEEKDGCTPCPNGAGDCPAKACKTASCNASKECEYDDAVGCDACPGGAATECQPTTCQTATCNASKQCEYTDKNAGASCGGASDCCDGSGTCDSTGASCNAGPGPATCTGEGYQTTSCGDGECCRDGTCEPCEQCYANADCANNAAGECCEYNSCVACPANCSVDADCSAYPGTCCIETDAGSGGQGVCISEGCPKPNPCDNDNDTDNDELYDCVDPCPGNGSGQTETCPGEQASHPSYFSVASCDASTATVTYNRAPQLKTNNCDPNDSISWVTIYWLGADGKADASMCTKVDEIPADGEVVLANVPCGETVYVLGHDGKFPDTAKPLYDKGSPDVILDGGCTSRDTGNKCALGSVTINCGTCGAE